MTECATSAASFVGRAVDDTPTLSIIVPVRNGISYLKQCVNAIEASNFEDYELIIVDDASDEDLSKVPLPSGTRLTRLRTQSGPAVARNVGAELANAELLLFVDADVLITKETLGEFVEAFNANPMLDATFGSYDDAPSAGNFVSQYRNLLHHFFHQTSSAEATTFWAGCGAIRRELFQEANGFSARFGRPSIEDIELGIRLAQAGRCIELNHRIQVKHLKKWTLWRMLKCDIFDRGVPWTRLILASGRIPNDLNLRFSQRISCVLTYGILCALLASVWVWSGTLLVAVVGLLAVLAIDNWTETNRIPDVARWLGISVLSISFLWASSKAPALFLVTGLLLLALVVVNRSFYLFLIRSRYPLFAFAAVPLHILYFTYCGIALGIGIVAHLLAPQTPSPAFSVNEGTFPQGNGEAPSRSE